MIFSRIKQTNKPLLTLLLVFLIIDIFLYGTYLYNNSSNNFIKILIHGKTFTDSLNSFPSTSYDVRINDGPSTLPGAKKYMLLGEIENVPYFDKNTEEFILPLKFIGKAENKYFVDLILGRPDNKIPVMEAPQGLTENQEINSVEVSTFINKLHKNDPIIVEVLQITNESYDKFAKNENCVEDCQVNLKRTRTMSENISLLYKGLSGESPIENRLPIINPILLIIYE